MCTPSLSARTTRCRSTATFPSELRHKYNVPSIPIRKDDEVQVDCDLPLGAAPQVQCALHPYPQGRRGAGRLRPSPRSCATSTMCPPSLSARTMRCRSTATFSLELRHKYNVRSIPIRKDDEVQVDCGLLLGAAPQVQCALHLYPQGR